MDRNNLEIRDLFNVYIFVTFEEILL